MLRLDGTLLAEALGGGAVLAGLFYTGTRLARAALRRRRRRDAWVRLGLDGAIRALGFVRAPDGRMHHRSMTYEPDFEGAEVVGHRFELRDRGGAGLRRGFSAQVHAPVLHDDPLKITSSGNATDRAKMEPLLAAFEPALRALPGPTLRLEHSREGTSLLLTLRADHGTEPFKGAVDLLRGVHQALQRKKG